MSLVVAESPAAYAARPPMVVDASIVAAAVFVESRCDEAIAIMQGRTLIAPAILDFEITNTAVNKCRRGLLDAEAARKALEKFAAFDVQRYEVAQSQSFVLAVECDLTAYDAAYLWLAIASNAPLATFDARLGEAARQRLAKPRGTR